MRERSVLFTKENRVKCIAGDKTQTRRLLIPQPPQEFCRGDIAAVCNSEGLWAIIRSKFSPGGSGCWPPDPEPGIKPKYQVGDHLWMLEPYQILNKPSEQIVHGYYADDRVVFDVELSDATFKKWRDRKYPYRKTSGRFMYKSLARYWFEVTGVGCEQVQDITWQDCKAEGIVLVGDEIVFNDQEQQHEVLRRKFKNLWDSINKKRGHGWDKNEWVFKYGLELITKN